MKKFILVIASMLLTQSFAYGQGAPVQPPRDGGQEQPVVDPIEAKIKGLITCHRPERKGTQSWTVTVLGDDDADKLTFMGFLDYVGGLKGLAGTGGYSIYKNQDIVVRRTTLYFNHDYFNNLKKYAEQQNKPELLEKIEGMKVEAVLKKLLEIEGLSLQCPSALERSMMAPRAGVVGSN